MLYAVIGDRGFFLLSCLPVNFSTQVPSRSVSLQISANIAGEESNAEAHFFSLLSRLILMAK